MVILQGIPTLPWEQMPKTPFTLLAFSVVILGIISYLLVAAHVRVQKGTVTVQEATVKAIEANTEAVRLINVTLTNHFMHDKADHALQIEFMRQIVKQNEEFGRYITEERVLREKS